MALIDHEGAGETVRVDLVGAEEIEDLDLARLARREDAFQVAAAWSRHKTEIEPADPRRRAVQHVEAVPVLADQSPQVSAIARASASTLAAVRSRQRACPSIDHRVLRASRSRSAQG